MSNKNFYKKYEPQNSIMKNEKPDLKMRKLCEQTHYQRKCTAGK